MRPSDSRYEPSCTRGVGVEDLEGAGDDGFLKCESASLVRGRAVRVSAAATSDSGRGVGSVGVGSGDEGLLVGLKKAGVLSACMVKRVNERKRLGWQGWLKAERG